MKAHTVAEALELAIAMLTDVADGKQRDRQVIYGAILTCQRSLDAHTEAQRQIARQQVEFRALAAQRGAGRRAHAPEEHESAA